MDLQQSSAADFDETDPASVRLHFNEADYLAANPDVARAVADGWIGSGLDHYLRFGISERRRLRPGVRPRPLKRPFPTHVVPTRRDRILSGLDPRCLDGVEIGPLNHPLVTPTEGGIFYIDHLDTEGLRKHYGGPDKIDPATIVEVDAVWGDNTLQDCIGAGRKVDYVVASHVIEHTPDLITWLREIRSILRPTGTLRLAIPDRRFTFDLLRLESRPHDVLDAYIRKARTPLPRLIIEHYSLVVHVDAKTAWEQPPEVAGAHRKFSTGKGLEIARDVLATGRYHDVHCWVVTPLSFAAMCIELAELDLLDFAYDYHFDTARLESEFYVSMSVSDDRAQRIASWKRMQAALAEAPAQSSAPDGSAT